MFKYDIRWDNEPDVEEYRRLCLLYPTNPEEATIGFEVLAERGSVASMLSLSSEYLSGRARPKDTNRAKFWLGKADAGGSAEASFFLGSIYSRENKNDEAFSAFSRGAVRNYLPAIYRLGTMYRRGLGTVQDIGRCRTLLEVAASRGHFFAKRDLATLYMRGRFGLMMIIPGILMLLSVFIEAVAFCVKSVGRDWEEFTYNERVLA